MSVKMFRKSHKQEPEKPTFHLFRHFYLLSVVAIAVILATACLGLRNIFHNLVLHEAERDAVRISRAISACEVKGFNQPPGAGQHSLHIPPERMSQVDRDLRNFLAPFDIVKIKVFNLDTRIIYSTDPSIIGKLNPDNTKLAKALSGTAVSKYETKEHVWDLEGEKHYEVAIVETYVPIYNDAGEIVGSFEIYKDVTEDFHIADSVLLRAGVLFFIALLSVFSTLMFIIHRAAEAIKSSTTALQENTHLNQILMDSMPCVALLMRPQTHEILISNKAAAEVGAVPGKQCFTAWPQRDEPCPGCLAPKLWATGHQQHSEIEHKGVSWEIHWIPVTEDLYIHYAYDITYRKKAEEEKKQLQDQLRQTQKIEAVGTLAGGIAHDFNNILAAIVGYADMALQDTPDGTVARSNIEQVLIAGSRAKELVRQILTFSRKTDQKQEPMQIAPIVTEALKMLRASIPANIEIRPNIEADPSVIIADPTQIHQVLMNLCTNALHAMDGDSGVLEVSLTDFDAESALVTDHGTLQSGPYVKLAVKDTGCGMGGTVMERIFEPFFTTKPVDKGTGMGLSVVHGIVENHGGIITVQSQLGKGTTFEVYFPRIEGSDVHQNQTIEIPPGKGEVILVVDDEKPLVDMMTQMLGRMGYTVVGKTASIDALDTFTAEPDSFDLVITDYAMPNMTGKELARALIAVKPDIPIILCTGFSENIDAESAKSMGIKKFVMKPVVRSEIAATIRNLLDKKEITV